MTSFSTYKLYKQGTSRVVSWLGKTAARFGNELDFGSKGMETTSTIHDGNSIGESDNQVTKRIVSVNQLPVLARVISEHSDEMSDPKTLQGVVEILKDVIRKRKSWATTFRLPDTSTVTSNTRHKHFVNVLQDVYEILGDAMKALQPGPDKGQVSSEADAVPEGKSTSMEFLALSNLFAVLDIEETADQTETIPRPASEPSSCMPARITYELEDEIDLEEVYVMVSSFFEDFQALRKHTAQSWADYMSGLLDLSTVAITTNVALEMLQCAETAMVESIPKKYNLNGYGEIIGATWTNVQEGVAISRGVDPNVRHRSDDVINMDLQDIPDLFCAPVYMIVSSFTKETFGRDIPIRKKGFYGEIDLSGRQMSWLERFNQDKIVLLEILQKFSVMKKLIMNPPVLDELSSGLIEMIRTRKIPIWLILGCQIYLDIHHAMLSDMDKALRDLQTVGDYVSTTLQHFDDYSKEKSIGSWSKEKHMAVMTIKMQADLWINCDLFGVTRKEIFGTSTPEATTEPYSILSRQPILCGVMLFHMNLKFQAAGVTLVDAWSSLASVVHLYNAVKRESAEEVFPEWQDVESIIQIQGTERIFVGGYPTNPEEYYKTFLLAFGYSASVFAPNRRVRKNTPDRIRKRGITSSRGPLAMIVTSPIADIFRDHYDRDHRGETRSEVTIHKLKDFFSTSPIGKKFGTGRNDMPLQFTSVSFLFTLRAHIQSNILALYIDYFALHIRCWDLLRVIHSRLDVEFCKIEPGYLEKDSHLPKLVGYLLSIATGKQPKALRKAGEDADATMRREVFTKAGELVKELVQKEGNREVERVRSVSNGFDWEYSEPDLEDLL